MFHVEPSELIQRQRDAYNARDIDLFMSFWAEDAEWRSFDGNLLASGSTQIRERHVARFKEPNLHANLVKRITFGDLVIDHEIVHRTFSEGTGQVEMLAIYEASFGKIRRACFRAGAPVLDEADWWLCSRWEI
jgi:putative hydrolase of HD superfamily